MYEITCSNNSLVRLAIMPRHSVRARSQQLQLQFRLSTGVARVNGSWGAINNMESSVELGRTEDTIRTWIVVW